MFAHFLKMFFKSGSVTTLKKNFRFESNPPINRITDFANIFFVWRYLRNEDSLLCYTVQISVLKSALANTARSQILRWTKLRVVRLCTDQHILESDSLLYNTEWYFFVATEYL